MNRVRERYLAEAYRVIALTAIDPRIDAEALLGRRATELALLLRGERQPLSRQEQEEVLRNRMSYFATDLVIPTWNAAFILDSEAGAAATLQLFEFANSHLLEFRYSHHLLPPHHGPLYPN